MQKIFEEIVKFSRIVIKYLIASVELHAIIEELLRITFKWHFFAQWKPAKKL